MLYDTRIKTETLVKLVTAGQTISGVMAVALASGYSDVVVSAERHSGLRLPAVGVVSVVSGISTGSGGFGVVSGQSVDMVFWGLVTTPFSGNVASGFAGKFLYVGSGGLVVNQSGFMDGASSGTGPGILSGELVQRLGIAVSGGIFVQLDPNITSGLLSGLLGQY